MARHVERLALVLTDAAALLLAFFGFRLAQGVLGLGTPVGSAGETFALPPVALLGGFWFVLFLFAGLYRERYAASRFDEFVTVLKVTTVGTLLLFFLLFIDRLDAVAAREGVVGYWALMLVFVGGARFAFRSVQKALILRGRGVHRAVIVGWSGEVEGVLREVQRYPEAGLRVVGAVRLLAEPMPELVVPAQGASAGPPLGPRPENGPPNGPPAADEPPAQYVGGDGVARVIAHGDDTPAFDSDGLSTTVHTIAALPRLIDRLGVQDVLIALGSGDHAYLDEVLRVCDGKTARDGRPVALKLVPDFYYAVGGMARTEHMYGLPLIEVLPVPTPAWERHAKRLIDVVVSLTVLTAGLPLWLAVGALVSLTSLGPAIYRQTRIGQQGRPFTMLKFRTMEHDAERDTGPVWAAKDDQRSTPLGRRLRALRLDEIPQLVNVLAGDMSLVGPRPERPFFVEKLVREIPLYSRRHRVKPGVTGLAQVKWRYDQDLEDVRQKLKYDLFYIENMSLRMDIQVLLQTVRAALSQKGQ